MTRVALASAIDEAAARDPVLANLVSRESPSIGASQRRRHVQANADSLTPHRIDSESTGAIASASVGPHESALG